MASLLRRVAKQRTASDYVRRLLHAGSRAGGTLAGRAIPAGTASSSP